MTMFSEAKTVPPSTGAIPDGSEQSAKVLAETAQNEETINIGATKKKSNAGLANYFRVFSFGTTFDYVLMFLSALASIASGVALPLMNVVFGQLVGTFTSWFQPVPSITRDEFMSEVSRLSLFMVYIFIAKFVTSYVSMFACRIGGIRISSALRLAYLRATFAQPVSVIDTISPGKVSTRITTSSNTIQLAISTHFAMLFQTLAFTIGCYVVAFIKGWLLTLVASAAIPFIVIVYGIMIPPFIRIHKVTEEHLEQASSLAFEIFSSIRIVVAFGAEAKLARQHEEILRRANTNEKRLWPIMGMMMAPFMMSSYGMFGLTFWFGVREYDRGNIDSISNIVVVLFSVMMAVMMMGRVASPIISITKAATAATELFETIDAVAPDTSGLKDPDISADSHITFENVAFSYPSRPNVQILDGLDVTFEAGKVTAIVGPSGSGKSTLVGLVQRWYDLVQTTAVSTITDKTEDTAPDDLLAEKPKKSKKSKKSQNSNKEAKTDKEDETELGPNTCTGAVKIGGVDLRDVDLKWWRSHIGLVQQEPFLFNDTLLNNVAFGLCGTKWEDVSEEQKLEMVKEACKEAYAEEFIDRLPQGYNTKVGESGIKLSGGQRQRIAIARSIVKKPEILILDEATSAIDVRTERIVQQALDRVSKDRTTIVIAHRLSTIKRADKIVVMRKGKLVEQGTHIELLEIEDGVYHGLVHAQELAMEAEEELEHDEGLAKTKTVETEKEALANEQIERTSIADPDYKQQSLVMSFGRLIYEQRSHWYLYITCIIGVLVAGAVYPIQAYLFAQVTEVFTLSGDDFVSQGYFWAGMFGVEAAGVGVAYFLVGSSGHLISCVIHPKYRQEYLVNMLRKRIPFFDSEGHSPGSLSSKLSTDTIQCQQLASTEMSMALIAVVNLIGSTIISFVYGWKLTLVGLFAALPPILIAGYVRFSLELKFEEMNAAVFEYSSQFATEAVGAFRSVVSLLMEDTIGDRYQHLLQGHVTEAFQKARVGTLVFAASDSVEMACMALAFWYGGTLLASREYGIENFFVIYMAIVQGAVAAGTWFSFTPNMAQATGAANRILSMRPPKDEKTSYEPLRSPTGGVSVDFQHVYFSYKNREVPVLSNLNISVAPGQFAALVGASGCGKSTTISLLERFYDADSGAVLYNGQDITAVDPAPYRQQISLVSQEPTLYEGTIRENIALSVDSATDDEIEHACSDAQIHEFIISLPEGYNTRLGTKGMSLSGGQKQRLSLARALLRKPRLLLLDEATSSLDSESEKLVQAAIERAANEGGRTVIAVAHRLATIQKADIIFVLGSGKVLESGDHQTLLRRKGIYYQMCQAQALDR
ncbi:P-loop containing nucleoside triphosphate hydrolase protein [Corynespora cassiicola Philippines]|uniref:P-loop containing nucleoside triphosphate hydrolase protein n=1 Tax=Corynespora cassiicola Philippines TaxID=1448308 RepID=A0A2T2P0V6_CORCC|nr:P-loop containing nucleoside triphosphate hydrolase protein [Corynespora cassiicola Philippines]